MMPLHNKRLLLGISGGVAAYKSAVLARLLVKTGAEIRVVMTRGAKAFVQPLTFQALTGHPVHDSLLDPQAEAGMGHIELARWADAIIIAPASANLLARLANGMADDLLTTLCLATRVPIHLAPAMNTGMWQHPATQANLLRLQQLGYHLIPPTSGELACGEEGEGRLPEPEELVQYLQAQVHQDKPAQGLRITLTAGPTREALDPVRYLSNHSSGKMGYALAEAAAELGAEVRLVSGPVHLTAPAGVTSINVTTAAEMLAACQSLQAQTDIFIACAAVADYRAEQVADQKIKKQAGQDTLTLQLVKNPDILATLANSEPRPFCVGFAAETHDVLHYACDKLTRKQIDVMLANDVSRNDIGFGSDDNQLVMIWQAQGQLHQQPLEKMNKRQLARQVLLQLIQRYQETQPQ